MEKKFVKFIYQKINQKVIFQSLKRQFWQLYLFFYAAAF